MMDTLRSTLTCPETQRLISRYTIPATTTISALAVLLYSRHCYLGWLALGEGGVSRTPLGWLFNVSAHLIARRDHRAVPAPYEKKSLSSSDIKPAIELSTSDEEKYSYIAREMTFFAKGGLPTRAGTRPDVPGTVIPQRQTTQRASQVTIDKQNGFMRSLALANPDLFRLSPSNLESPRFEALWLAEPDDVPAEEKIKVKVDKTRVKWFSRLAPGEVSHVHGEGSIHLYLSLVDAAEVVREGWGERHKLSGVRDLLPWNYVLIYAPREGDWEAWKNIVIASVRVVTKCAGFEGEVVVPEE
ncbi:hypothetical protein F5Y16DRAFT_216722 [Xylariaceae sp. FL0255]|nr:hypothetical protein F5Y16DRAFT_216722 [Xylariaceae sp. FL0255]